MIQILTYNGKNTSYNGKDTVVNSLHDARSLDDFEINIIDLQNMSLWENNDSSNTDINDVDDLESLGIMIDASNCPNIIILFPQNVVFRYDYSRVRKAYDEQCELKNIIPNLLDILSNIYLPIETIELRYENTSTKILDEKLSASFCFCVPEEDVLIASEKSRRPTVVKCSKVILSTLAIQNYKEVIALLKELGIIKEKIGIPDWMEDIKMFDDMKQLEEIQKNSDIIKESQNKIDAALRCIERNNRYKSILYTNGDELVDVVFEILEEMLGCNLHDFEDKKKEDFSFKREDTIYIGEIKGISSNIKSANITQLELHYRGFLDEHEDIDENSIRQLLVIAHQRGAALDKRDPVDRKQIELAERNGSLIIETYTLLKMFEKYQGQELTRGQCFELLDRKGLLHMDDA